MKLVPLFQNYLAYKSIPKNILDNHTLNTERMSPLEQKNTLLIY